MPNLISVSLRRLRLPLIRPYRLSYRTFEEFEPYLIEMADDRGRTGFADGHISPGSSEETREGGWTFIRKRIPEMLGSDLETAKAEVLKKFEASKVATTALACAVEVLADNPLLACETETTLPLLTPINGMDDASIQKETGRWVSQGCRTFRSEVAKDVEAELSRVTWIQKVVVDRATIRVDANR